MRACRCDVDENVECFAAIEDGQHEYHDSVSRDEARVQSVFRAAEHH